MTLTFEIGQSTPGETVRVDASILADTRALINASSGLGKSHLLRLIAEHVATSIQTIIIDPEGEFPTLREALDILIVSENGGDIRPDVHSAGLLARKLAETGVSAVVDLYDLPGNVDPWVKRRAFVAEFIGALMNLPKSAYHPMLIKIDEAHQFASETAHGDSANKRMEEIYRDADLRSRSAIRTLMSAGRKRGFGGILATQRISKIDKDSIADVRNWIIGGATLDIDQGRAGDILGMSKKDSVILRDLDPGEFFAFGPAFLDVRGVIRFQSGEVITTHPKAGQRASLKVPKASTQISSIAKQFADLPQVAEEERQTLDSLQKEVTTLRRQLSARPQPVQSEPKIVEVKVIDDSQIQAIQSINQEIRSLVESFKVPAELLSETSNSLTMSAQQLDASLRSLRSNPGPSAVAPRQMFHSVPTPSKKPEPFEERITVLTGPQQRIIDAIAWMESIGIDQPSQVAVAFLAGYTYGGGAFNNPKSALNTAGLVEYVSGNRICLTDAGRQYANYPKQSLTAEDLQAKVFEVLPGPERAILQTIIAYRQGVDSDWVSIEEIAANTMSSRGTPYQPEGGAFGNPLSRLKTLGLIERNSGMVKASPILFLE